MTTKLHTILVVSAAIMLFACGDGLAGGGFKGKGGGNRGGPSRGGPSRGGAKPSARPSRPSTPNLGGNRPTSRPSSRPGSRPSASRPAVSRPSAQRPTRPSTSRPSTSRPQVNQPSGGIKPSMRPGSRPSTPTRPSTKPAPRPGTRPDTSRPSTRPGTTSPGISSRPSTQDRPSVPDLGGGKPNRPVGGNRPDINLPNRPGGDRPGANLPNRPGGSRPDRPSGNLPNRPGGGGRPDAGDVGDFLGMDKPLRPGGNRPGGAGDRPGIANRPGVGNRPSIGDRPNFGDINVGDINIGNKVINNRPTWANIDRNQINNINNRWQNQIGGMHNWGNRHPDRINYWSGWGDGVRSHRHHQHYDYFSPNWWSQHSHGFGGWHYSVHFHDHSPSYWWSIPTFAACTSFFNWGASNVWSQPVYYDYGQGGNVVYENSVVYINGEQVASADEFAQSAAALASVPPPASEEEAAQAEWMPLGTFAVARDPQDVDPNTVIQLAVSKQGIISGTLYNTKTDQAYTVQGQVDQETQRVAFRIGESDDIVIESGLYNLTQQDAPVLVHFGTDQVENWLLVRLENPDEEQG